MHPQTCACMQACMHARTHIDTHTHTLTHSHTPYTDSHTSTMICDKTKSIHIYRDVSSKKIGTGCASLDTAAASRFTALARRLLSRLSHLPANSQNLSIVQIQFFFWFWWTLFFSVTIFGAKHAKRPYTVFPSDFFAAKSANPPTKKNEKEKEFTLNLATVHIVASKLQHSLSLSSLRILEI